MTKTLVEYLEDSLSTAKDLLDMGFERKNVDLVAQGDDEVDNLLFCLDLIEDWATYYADENYTVGVERK